MAKVLGKPSAEDVRRVALAALVAALDDGKEKARKRPGLTGMRAVATGAVLYTAGRAAISGRRFVNERLGDDEEPEAESDEDYDEPEAEEDEDYEEPEAEEDDDFDEPEEPEAEEDEDFEEPQAEEDEDFEEPEAEEDDDFEEPEAEEDEDYDEPDEDDEESPADRPPVHAEDEGDPEDSADAELPERPSRSRRPVRS